MIVCLGEFFIKFDIGYFRPQESFGQTKLVQNYFKTIIALYSRSNLRYTSLYSPYLPVPNKICFCPAYRSFSQSGAAPALSFSCVDIDSRTVVNLLNQLSQ